MNQFLSVSRQFPSKVRENYTEKNLVHKSKMSHEAILLVIFNIGYLVINFVLIDVTQSFLESIPMGRKMVRNKY